MIQIVMKPDYAIKRKGGENCYGVMFNGEDIGFRVFGRKASHAEEKLMVIFREQLTEKVVNYDLEAYKRRLEDGKAQEPAPEEGTVELNGSRNYVIVWPK